MGSIAAMGDFLNSASAILGQAERRLEISSQNIANIATPGYKRRIGFAQMLAPVTGTSAAVEPISTARDFSAGSPVETGNPFDLAISGNGFFLVRSGDRVLLTRQGQFQRDVNGRLILPQGAVLQSADGGDLIVKGQAMTVSPDGVVLENGEPVARLAIAEPADPAGLIDRGDGMFEAETTTPSGNVRVHQGMLESSNVSLADEMITLMESLRRAEAGQRLVNTYDDLMGRALSAFGQG